jgi:threonine/homoserine/homoserine lactone efflux protein
MVDSLVAFALVAALLTMTPGVDTLLMLRTATSSGGRAAFAANFGIGLGCFCWAAASASGLTALLAASQTAYDAVRFAGAGYLCWLGIRAFRHRSPVRGSSSDATVADVVPAPGEPMPSRYGRLSGPFRQGLLTNLLNPKVGVVYLSLLPQFVPRGYRTLPTSLLLASVHSLEGLTWCGVLVLAVDRARTWLTRPRTATAIERITGVVFIGLGVRLAVDATRP